MKKILLGLFLFVLATRGSMSYATNTDCWDGLGTVPTTTYASGIVYGCDGNIPIITIYGDDGKGITIKAMNEGATAISFSGNDTNSYGNMYQWGNSYGFPSVAGPTTIDNSGSTAVSAEGYAPGTYNSGTWIKQYQWDSSDNRNLWGGSGDRNLNGAFWGFNTGTFTVINAISRGAMCPEGYHIPSAGERSALLYLWGKNYDKNQGTFLFSSRGLSNLNYERDLNGIGNRFSEDMQIPFVGIRTYLSTVSLDWYSCYWSSSPFDNSYAREFCLNSNDLRADYETGRGYGNAVRCFKNEYVHPTYSLTFDSQGGSEVETGITVENTPRTRPADPTKDGYTFVDWYTSTGYEDVFDFTGTLATGDLTVYAKWHDVRCGADLSLDYDEENELCYKKNTTYNVPIYYGTDMNNSHSYNNNPIGTITIKLPDGNTLTIMDMNLGATVSGTTCSTTNTGVCGHHFQWGNNYGFESCYTNNCTGLITTGTRDIYKNYWLGHPYISDIFIYGGNIYDYWNSSKIGDSTQFHFDILRGGIGDSNNTTSIDTFRGGINNGKSRQGPCPSGYHVPSRGERNALITYRRKTKDSSCTCSYNEQCEIYSDNNFRLALKLPLAGFRTLNKASIYSQGKEGYYWTSSPVMNDNRAHDFYFYNSDGRLESSNRGIGLSLRCFKDSPKAPETLTLTFSGNGGNLLGTTSGTLDQLVASGHLAQQPVNPTKTGASFQWWSEEGNEDTAFDFSSLITETKTLKAIYECETGYKEIEGECIKIYTITYNLNGGIESRTNPTTYTATSGTFGLYQPTRTGYMFLGWTGSNGNEVNANLFIPWGSTGDKTYNAVWGDFEDIDAYFISETGAVSYVTLMDRNMGASSDDITSTGSYGFRYQWGNNNGFADGCRTVGCSDEVTRNMGSSRPGWSDSYNAKGYYGVRFITSNIYNNYDYWSQSWHSNHRYNSGANENLWGGTGDYDNNDGLTSTNPIVGRTGPCPVGYHVPSIGERRSLSKYWVAGNLSYQFQQDLNISFAGYRSIDNGAIYNQGSGTVLWSSSPYSHTGASSYGFTFGRVGAYPNYRANGNSVRCFSNDYVLSSPSMIIHPNGGTGTVIIVEGGRVKSLGTLNRPYSQFEGWYDAGIEGNKIEIGNDAPANLYARWSCQSGYIENNSGTGCIELYKITYILNDGVLSGENVTGYTIESEAITLINPTKTGYTFTGRSGTDIDGFSTSVIIPSCSTGDREYEASWEVKQYTITFKDGENEITSITADYGTGITPPANPTKNGYRFIGWEPEVPATMPAEDLDIKATWDRNGSSGGGGGGGGGGGSSSSSSSTGSDTSNQQSGTGTNNSTGTQNDQTTTGMNVNEPEGTGNNAEIQTGNQTDTPDQDSQENDTDTSNNNTEGQTNSQWGSTYSEEFQQAYEFAKGRGITTMPTIQKANMNGPLTRIAMAKMLSQYAINVLGQKAENTVVPKFNDVTDKQNSDYDYGVSLAYQLGIMGQNMPNNNFRPTDEVTRAEFATALSRMLYNTSDGEYKSTSKYYTHHMEKLKEEGIITKDDPAMKELRGYVMIMLMRSAK